MINRVNIVEKKSKCCNTGIVKCIWLNFSSPKNLFFLKRKLEYSLNNFVILLKILKNVAKFFRIEVLATKMRKICSDFFTF